MTTTVSIADLRHHFSATSALARAMGANVDVHLGIVSREQLDALHAAFGGERKTHVYEPCIHDRAPFAIDAWVAIVDGLDVMAQAPDRPPTKEELELLAAAPTSPKSCTAT